jgi:hypothetical protein
MAMDTLKTLALCLLVHAVSHVAHASEKATPADAGNQARLEALRAQIADQIQLSAYDLLDELVYGWTVKPVFTQPTQVVLVSIGTPVGLGSGLQALLENHLANLLIKNPNTHMTLSHCPTCTAIIMHSGPKGTIVSRGIDNPEALKRLGGAQVQHALFVDIEAEGQWLVLRSRMTHISPKLPIIWSRTISSSARSASLLRHPDHLKSAAEARQDYLDVLAGRNLLTLPLRFALRSYRAAEGSVIPPPPLIWLQGGIEINPTQAKAWSASMILGFAWFPEAYDGLMAQARISRLLTGQARSLSGPNLYLFFGASLISLSGPTIIVFQNENITSDDILSDSNLQQSRRTTFGTWHVGLELRVANRIGISFFVEHIPALASAPNLGKFIDLGFAEPQTLGTELSFCF